MIINIPLQIDDEMINSAVTKDYQRKIEDNLTKLAEKSILQHAGYYYSTKESGMDKLVERAVENTIDKYRDQIIEKASLELAKRIARTKRGKEILTDETD